LARYLSVFIPKKALNIYEKGKGAEVAIGKSVEKVLLVLIFVILKYEKTLWSPVSEQSARKLIYFEKLKKDVLLQGVCRY
jgi:hypothetical protein